MQVTNHLKKLRLCRLLFALSLILVAYYQYAVAVAQEPVKVPTVSSETYQRVLDLIFPRNSGNFRDQTKEFSLSLRFTPSFEAGSQINITKHSDGRLEVVTYTLSKRNQSIGEQLNVMLRQVGREDTEEMAKRLNVQRTVISHTTKVRQLLSRFASICFSPDLDASITLDATRFELWNEAVSNESYYSLVGGEPGQDRANHPLVRWMNEVRQAVLR